MPTRARKPCTVAGCPALTERGGRCEAHRDARYPCRVSQCPAFSERWGLCSRHLAASRAERDGGRPSAARRGYGAQWRGVRRAYLRLNPSCAECAEPATEVDHVTPRRLGGTDDPGNLQPLCRAHHSAKTNRERARGPGGRSSARSRRPGAVGISPGGGGRPGGAGAADTPSK